jgi:Protein of unknown function (DUF3152)
MCRRRSHRTNHPECLADVSRIGGLVGFVVGIACLFILVSPVSANRRVHIGSRILYAVRVDTDTGVDASSFLEIIGQALHDPRSWEPMKHTVFVQAPWKQARLRIRVRSPRNTDRSCAPFKTSGVKSCSRNWEVFFNSDRWLLGAAPSQMSLEEYRTYMVNHEVGHSLGEDHQPCKGVGSLASVMLQQTIGLQGCLPNPWPNPAAAVDKPST